MDEKKRLYRGKQGEESRREIERRYEERGESPARAEQSYDAIVGKVAREQAAERGGAKVEDVRAHRSHSATGTPEEVRAHQAVVTEDDDLPRSRRGGDHKVEGFDRIREGRPEHVGEHRAKNPRR